MGKVKVKMNTAGARAVMNSSEVQADLLDRANRIKARADSVGSGSYDSDVQAGKNRAHAMVKTRDIKSKVSNAKNNTLIKALDAGR